MSTQVHLLYFEGCPNADRARRLLREAFSRVGGEPQWIEMDTASADCPAEWRGFPSPTILVQGAEASSGKTACPGTASCRFAGLPDIEDIASKLKESNAGAAISPSVIFSIPWCCVLPAILSLAGLGSAVAARGLALKLNPLFLFLSVVFLGRAHYLLYWKGHGNIWSRRLTWGATVLVAALWLPRLTWILR